MSGRTRPRKFGPIFSSRQTKRLLPLGSVETLQILTNISIIILISNKLNEEPSCFSAVNDAAEPPCRPGTGTQFDFAFCRC